MFKAWYRRNSVAIWSTVIGIAALFSPMLLSMPAQFGIVFTNETGAAGDTFGGFANPFISILVAYLTYQAFMQQKRANEQQIARLEKQEEAKERLELISILDNKFSYMWKLIDETIFVDESNKLEHRGVEAVKKHQTLKAGDPDRKAKQDYVVKRTDLVDLDSERYFLDFLQKEPLTDGVFSKATKVCRVYILVQDIIFENRKLLNITTLEDYVEDLNLVANSFLTNFFQIYDKLYNSPYRDMLYELHFIRVFHLAYMQQRDFNRGLLTYE